jgi:hypothetical protein
VTAMFQSLDLADVPTGVNAVAAHHGGGLRRRAAVGVRAMDTSVALEAAPLELRSCRPAHVFGLVVTTCADRTCLGVTRTQCFFVFVAEAATLRWWMPRVRPCLTVVRSVCGRESECCRCVLGNDRVVGRDGGHSAVAGAEGWSWGPVRRCRARVRSLVRLG